MAYSITLQCYSIHPPDSILDVQSEGVQNRVARKGRGTWGKTEIQEGLACIITLSRWHIYRLCQRGHAFCRSKRSGVWKSQLRHTGWPFNNYYHIPSTHYHDGDCDFPENYNFILFRRRRDGPAWWQGPLWRISTIKWDERNKEGAGDGGRTWRMDGGGWGLEQ